MPDDLDRAQVINEQLQRDALEAHRRRQPTGPGRLDCEECGAEIPAARREMVPGCTRCVECQTDHERAIKRGFK